MKKYLFIAAGVLVTLALFVGCGGDSKKVTELETQIKSLEAQLAAGPAPVADATKPVGYGARLELVRERGKILCADNTSSVGWGFIDEDGKNAGFGPDYCKAYAAAIFGDAEENRWEVVGISYAERPTVMQSGEIDVMTIANTWTALREIQWGNFVDIIHYTGLGIVSTKESGIVPGDYQSLDGMTGCTTAGTNYIQMAADMQAEYGIEFELNTYEAGGARDAYDAGRCDFSLGGSDSNLSFVRQLNNSKPDDHNAWKDVYGKDPWAMLVPHGDDQWFDIMRMVGWILVNAEEAGVTQANVEDLAKNSKNAKILRMLGSEGTWGQDVLNLDQDVAVNIIKAVGNLGEMLDRWYSIEAEEAGRGFYRNRALDHLYKNGGLIYVPEMT